MNKTYNHSEYEREIYTLWEKSGGFSPITNPKAKPFTILMPPPNANASLHAGHAMYTVDDVLIRFRRMQGYSALWIPGMDHAGFETQYVYEKHLAKAGKSRLDFDRETLYDNIFSFVKENSGLIYEQFKRLGFSADWSRSVFTLDESVIAYVFETFAKMETDGYVYRDDYIVNYCVFCGTSLAELEVVHLERPDPLYFVRYPRKDGKGFVVVATVRPEPIFVDTHLAVNPKDKKNKHLIGVVVLNPLTGAEMEIIGEDYVDPQFGTGVVKLTPAHDPDDFMVAKRRNLPIEQAIEITGRIGQNGGKYAGLKVRAAREAVVADLQEKSLVEKIDTAYTHSVTACYKCGRDLEPLTIPNWFIRVAELKKKVKGVVEKDGVRFYPPRFKKHMLTWLAAMRDWPISRQIVWGIRLPVWYGIQDNPAISIVFLDKKGKAQKGKLADLIGQFSLEEIKKGLQRLQAPIGSSYIVSPTPPGDSYLQETDTFDTWFSSGQWPLVTLKENELTTRLPTNALGTLSDILKFWVSRMILFSLYRKNNVPFRDVYLWSMVADAKGMKMSKSKGNVINPLDLVEKYGADALRMSLLFGTPAGSKVILSEDKVRGMRNFANKIWNIGRYILLQTQDKPIKKIGHLMPKISTASHSKKQVWCSERLVEIAQLEKAVTAYLEKYDLDKAVELVYEYVWHTLADEHIETSKIWLTESDGDSDYVRGTLVDLFERSLRLLHPFMPFVTEAVWQELQKNKLVGEKMLMNSNWPVNS